MAKTKQAKAAPAAVPSPLYYSLHTLLETIRVIKVYEDPLCTLLHAIQTSAAPSQEVQGELQALLDEMPSQAYLHELDGVRGTLGMAPPRINTGGLQASKAPSAPAARQSPAKSAARSRVPVKRTTAAAGSSKRK